MTSPDLVLVLVPTAGAAVVGMFTGLPFSSPPVLVAGVGTYAGAQLAVYLKAEPASLKAYGVMMAVPYAALSLMGATSMTENLMLVGGAFGALYLFVNALGGGKDSK